MRIYFLASRYAALKLNGEYLGVIGAIEKYTEIADGEEVFAEVIPPDEFLPCAFFIGRNLFENPPLFLNVYMFDGGIQICVTHFERSDRGFNILEQSKFAELDVTLFMLGGKTYLSCDGQKSCIYALPDYFENCRLTEQRICGFPVIFAEGANCLCAISSTANKLYTGQVKSYSTGDMLRLTVDFKSCTGYYAEREYSYNGQELTLSKNVVKKRYGVESSVRHFAFFEALLFGANCEEYLSEDMQGATKALQEYLGAYCEVCVPNKTFYDRYGDICAAALAYPIRDNLFEIKYFSVEYMDGKIDNINRID